jgi:hypothetical protein
MEARRHSERGRGPFGTSRGDRRHRATSEPESGSQAGTSWRPATRGRIRHRLGRRVGASSIEGPRARGRRGPQARRAYGRHRPLEAPGVRSGILAAALAVDRASLARTRRRAGERARDLDPGWNCDGSARSVEQVSTARGERTSRHAFTPSSRIVAVGRVGRGARVGTRRTCSAFGSSGCRHHR